MKKLFTVLAAVIVVALIIFGILRWIGGEETPETRQPEDPGTSAEALPEQPAHCPAVEVLAVPGTWESRVDDDPTDPNTMPMAMLEHVTQPLQQRYSPEQVKVWTVPYAAQLRNISSQEELSYDDSRAQGRERLNGELAATHSECPLTNFIMMGFSQGAAIAGDIAHDIGVGQGLVPADRVLGVALLADPRRVADAGQVVGNPVAGVGIEVSMQPFNGVMQPITPGATMMGAREGGFGSLQDRTFEICAPDDHICDSPINIVDALVRARGLIEAGGVHAMYVTNPNVIPGTTAPQWMVEWAEQLIDPQL